MKKFALLLLASSLLSGCAYTKAYSVYKQSSNDSDLLKQQLSRFDNQKKPRFTPAKAELVKIKDNFRAGYFESTVVMLDKVGADKKAIQTINDQKDNINILYKEITGVRTVAGDYYCGKYRLENSKDEKYLPFIVDLTFKSNSANTSEFIYNQYCS